jgi:arginyl-tRNA synthetase
MQANDNDITLLIRDLIIETILAWSGKSAEELGCADNLQAFTPVRPPKPEMGDLAFPCFPLAKTLKQAPPRIAGELVPVMETALGKAAAEGTIPAVATIAALGPYLNVTFRGNSLAAFVCDRISQTAAPYGTALPPTGKRTMVEYSAPNTNKPLHLGHVRNNLLGLSLCNIFAAAGEEVIPVNLVNDRGVHIAKSMIAYHKWGEGATPESTGIKGDHFVGKYYVQYARELEKEMAALAAADGIDPSTLDDEGKRDLENRAPLTKLARQWLLKWEEEDPEIRELWERMNSWVYSGFDVTYARLGCAFKKWYLESDTYKLGKALVEKGVNEGIFERRSDGSIWAPLEADGLKDKILQRADGTSVYITQDLGTAALKHSDFNMDRSIYVVGSEQLLHFKLLFMLLGKLGFQWADGCLHLSYGLVTLPKGMGKLKSREGRAVDADTLLDELAAIAKRKAADGGFAKDASLDLDRLADQIGQGALKMYLLQVSAEKNIQFDPDATLDFEGDTGPAVQYSHARICSIVRKAVVEKRISLDELISAEIPDPFANLGTGAPDAAIATPATGAKKDALWNTVAQAVGLRLAPDSLDCLTMEEEKRLALELAMFPNALRNAVNQVSPSPIAGYLLDLTKSYARFYHGCPVLRAETPELMRARLHLSLAVAALLRRGLALLGIQAPDAM